MMTIPAIADFITAHQTVPKLYLLTNDDEFSLLYKKLELALATGVISLLQIRRKKLLAQKNGRDQLLIECRALIELAQHYQVEVIINDDVALAKQLKVGVHLGQGDGSIVEARACLGDQAMIGRTCHQDANLVHDAKVEGASYAAMGALFSSLTKPEAHIVSHQQLIEGLQQGIKLCVIGGITLEKVTAIQGLPIEYIAIVGDIMNLPESQIVARCEAWRQLLLSWNDTNSCDKKTV